MGEGPAGQAGGCPWEADPCSVCGAGSLLVEGAAATNPWTARCARGRCPNTSFSPRCCLAPGFSELSLHGWVCERFARTMSKRWGEEKTVPPAHPCTTVLRGGAGTQARPEDSCCPCLPGGRGARSQRGFRPALCRSRLASPSLRPAWGADTVVLLGQAAKPGMGGFPAFVAPVPKAKKLNTLSFHTR